MPDQVEQRMQFRRAHILLTLLAAVLLGPGANGAARADVLDGLLEVKSAYVNTEQGVFQLFARIAYPVNDDIRAALKDGLMLTFDLDVVVSRERRFLCSQCSCISAPKSAVRPATSRSRLRRPSSFT